MRELERQPWYHGDVARKSADALLTQNGDFLVLRAARNRASLSSRWGLIKHVIIPQDEDGKYRHKYPFESVPELVEYYLRREEGPLKHSQAVRARHAVGEVPVGPAARGRGAGQGAGQRALGRCTRPTWCPAGAGGVSAAGRSTWTRAVPAGGRDPAALFAPEHCLARRRVPERPTTPSVNDGADARRRLSRFLRCRTGRRHPRELCALRCTPRQAWSTGVEAVHTATWPRATAWWGRATC